MSKVQIRLREMGFKQSLPSLVFTSTDNVPDDLWSVSELTKNLEQHPKLNTTKGGQKGTPLSE